MTSQAPLRTQTELREHIPFQKFLGNLLAASVAHKHAMEKKKLPESAELEGLIKSARSLTLPKPKEKELLELSDSEDSAEPEVAAVPDGDVQVRLLCCSPLCSLPLILVSQMVDAEEPAREDEPEKEKEKEKAVPKEKDKKEKAKRNSKVLILSFLLLPCTLPTFSFFSDPDECRFSH